MTFYMCKFLYWKKVSGLLTITGEYCCVEELFLILCAKSKIGHYGNFIHNFHTLQIWWKSIHFPILCNVMPFNHSIRQKLKQI